MELIFNRYRSLLILPVIFIILIGLIVLTTKNLLRTQQDVDSVHSDIDKLQKKLSVIETNKSLTASQIENYNKLLTQLVPNEEDYFSILFALEELSNKTGFSISKYTINLSLASPEKLQVTVNGDGDADAFFKFLQNYQFGGGRLVTNESIGYTSEKVGQINLALNFYSKKTDTTSQELPQLTTNQIELMQEIQNKTSIIVKDSNEDLSVIDYKTKENPF